jgi:hypothetical protein
MAFPLGREAIPTGDGGALRAYGRRTALLRAVFALALVAALAYAFTLTRGADNRPASLVPGETTAMLVLDLSASIGDYRRVGDTLRRVAREEEDAGLIVFSDGAYELLPPGAPGRELEPFARFFTPVGADGEYPRNPWDVAEFRGGTSISSGLRSARDAFERDGVSRGSILLASDLDVEADSHTVRETVVALRKDGIEIRIIPVGALPRHVAFFEALLGRTAFLAEEGTETPVATPEERSLGGVQPWGFLLAAALVVALLAANERLLSRLEVGA